MQHTRHTFRNIPTNVILEAKIHALQTERTLGQLVSDALEFLIEEETTSGGEEEVSA